MTKAYLAKPYEKMRRKEIDLLEKYTVTRHFRCTKEESSLIDEKARNERKSPSAYLRDSALCRNIPSLDENTMQILKDLAANELKIGININQVARLCNTKKSVSLHDLNLLRDDLVLLLEERKQIVMVLQEMGRL